MLTVHIDFKNSEERLKLGKDMATSITAGSHSLEMHCLPGRVLARTPEGVSLLGVS